MFSGCPSIYACVRADGRIGLLSILLIYLFFFAFQFGLILISRNRVAIHKAH